MRRDRRFWRFVILIALAHLALLFGLQQWSRATNTVDPQSITWLSADEGESASADDETPTPEPEPSPHARQELDERLVKPPTAKSEIQLPTPTPTPTPTPRPKETPRATPKHEPTPKKKSAPKEKATPKPKTSPGKKTSASPAKKKSTDDKPKPKSSPTKANGSSSKAKGTGSAKGSKGSASSGSASGKAPGWYGDMLHDRFYKAWQQPETVVATGVKLSAGVRIRIEKDGRVSDFKIIRPSGNVVVDDSIKAVASRVTRVDALPATIANAAPYSVDINFALNADK